MNYKILTFNHHEAYLLMLAATGQQFDVVTQHGTTSLAWNPNAQTPPENFKLVAFDRVVRKKLADGFYDFVICHTLKSLFWVLFSTKSKIIFIAHIPLFKKTPSDMIKSFVKRFTILFLHKFFNVGVVAITDHKLQTWSVPGTVIKNSCRVFPQARQALQPEILYVGNRIKERGEELGYSLFSKINDALPVQVIGNNPSIKNSVTPKNFEEFLNLFRQGHLYVYPIDAKNGDGFNLSMLEAMGMGMAVVCIANPTSPIRHNENGMVGNSAEDMISILNELRMQPEKIAQLGEAAKRTIENDFSLTQFAEKWNQYFKEHKT